MPTLRTYLLDCVLCGTAAVLVAPVVFAQNTIGTVRTDGAHVQGVVSVSSGKATLQNNGTVTAGPQTSDVELSRGGTVKVCAGSTVSFSQSAAPRMASPMSRNALLVALQRGATEIRTGVQRNDAVLTPDLRVEMSDSAVLDLRLRVNNNGATCVETNCGCPKNGKGGKDDFPEAVSAGLVAPETPAVPQGNTHVQIAAGFDYNGATGTATGPPAPGSIVPSVTTQADAAPAQAPVSAAPARPASKKSADEQESGGNPFRAIGRFFRRLFGGS